MFNNWLKENKIGPFQEDEVNYDALYQSAKREGKVVVYAGSSRGSESLAMGFYDKYPGIKAEWNTLGHESISKILEEQQAGIYNVDILYHSNFPTQVNVLHLANMIFPWVPPDLKKVIPLKFRDPLLAHRLTAQTLFYNIDTWPDKPPVDSWWDITRPEWKGKLVIKDTRTNASALHFFTTFVLNAKEMAKDYKQVFGKPLELTTPNAGYEWIKMVLANEPKEVKADTEARYIGKPGQAQPSLGIGWDLPRITDTGDPKYGDLQLSAHVTLKPRMGMQYPILLNIAYKAPHPNAAKLLIRWLFGDEKGGGGNAPWFTPGNMPARADVKGAAPHPFNSELSWHIKDLKFWFMDARGIWEKQKEVQDFINRHR
jgi:iron(III) transport system substrate-binding protein